MKDTFLIKEQMGNDEYNKGYVVEVCPFWPHLVKGKGGDDRCGHSDNWQHWDAATREEQCTDGDNEQATLYLYGLTHGNKQRVALEDAHEDAIEQDNE